MGLRWPPETFLQWKLERLAARGFRVTVTSRVPLRSRASELPGVRLKRLPRWQNGPALRFVGVALGALALGVRNPARLKRLVHELRHPVVEPRWRGFSPTAGRLARLLPLARLGPDLVHFEWESAAVYHLPLFAVWRCPVVVSCHGAGINVHPHTGQFGHWLRGYPEIFRRASAIHCVSEALAREVAVYGAEPAKVHVIRPAVDTDFFQPAKPTAARGHELRIVSIGDLNWIKGHAYGLQALRDLLDQGVPARYDIFGGDPPQETAEQTQRGLLMFTIHDLRLETFAQLHGEVSSRDVREHLQQAHVLLHSSVSEGIPTAVLEAMASGLPVVATDCGGIREAVTDGVEGLIVRSRAPAEIATALARLAGDPALRERMGHAGRARVVAEFGIEQQVDAFAKLYEQVIASSAARA